MEQQSAFSMYNKHKQKFLKPNSKLSNPFKLKKTHAKKKHLVLNINKDLSQRNNKKKFKKRLKKNKLLSNDPKSNEKTANTNNQNGIVGSKQKTISKPIAEKQRKLRIADISTPAAPDIDSDGDEIPKLIKIPDNTNTMSKASKRRKQVEIGENSIETGKELLYWIIQPTTVADFFDSRWEKAPLHVKRNNSKYFTELFSSEALDAMLRDHPLFFKTNVDIAMYEDGLRKDADTIGRAFPSLVWDFYGNNYTVRISDPQTYNFKLRNLLSTLQEFFGCFVSSNVYLTPPGSQGFAPHYDDIEAFILQIEGRKHWKLYKPPTDEDVLARESSKNYARAALAQPPIMEITLNAGDMLYFPRGTVHEGRTDDDSHSLHITVSTYQKTAYADLMETVCAQALKKAFASAVAYRRGLPLQYLMHAGAVNTNKKTITRNDLMRTVRNLFQGLWEHVDIDSAVDEMGRAFMKESLPPQHLPQERQRTSWLDGDHLLDGRVLDKAEFSPDTKVRLLRYHCIRLVVDKAKKEAKIYYNISNKAYKEVEEQYLDVELSDTPIVQSLLHAYPRYISIESIPHAELDSKINLVTVLWQYRLIVTETVVDVVNDDDDDVQMATEIVDSNEDSDSESESDFGEEVPTPTKLQKRN